MGILVVSLESYLCRLDIKRAKIRKIVKKIDTRIVTLKQKPSISKWLY